MGAIFGKLAMALNLLAILFSVGVFVYTEMVYKRPLPKNKLEEQKFREEVNNIVNFSTYKMDKLTINLTSETRRLRFLDIQMHLLPFYQEDIDFLKQKTSMIHDSVIDLAGRMSPEQLNSLEGKVIFENRIKEAVNEKFTRPVIKKIFFTVFVVQ